MNYKEIYKFLKGAGAIEKVLLESDNDRAGLMKGIRFLEYFIDSRDFHRKGYWKSEDANPTVSKVCIEFTKLQIDAYQYMASKMK